MNLVLEISDDVLQIIHLVLQWLPCFNQSLNGVQRLLMHKPIGLRLLPVVSVLLEELIELGRLRHDLLLGSGDVARLGVGVVVGVLGGRQNARNGGDDWSNSWW